MLDQDKVKKLETFLANRRAEVYAEPSSRLHTDLTSRMLDFFLKKYSLNRDSKILDVGCGQGLALDLFKKQRLEAIGITLDPQDLTVCLNKGFSVFEMDQSFLEFADEEFDFIWCRHCLEHSIFPYFTLVEFFRVLKPGGYLYVEVPAPDTSCKHQTNQNHYSVLGKSMWAELIVRTGFRILEIIDINFDDLPGPDTYFAYIQTKPKRGENADK